MGKLTLTEHLKACAEAAKSFTNGLVAELAQTVTEAMQEMENVKADKQARCPHHSDYGLGRR